MVVSNVLRGSWWAGAVSKLIGPTHCHLSFSLSSMPLLRLFPLLFLIHLTNAVIIPFRGFTTDNVNHLSKRNNLTGIPVKNQGNVIYGADITLGGNNFSVILDSGRHVYPLLLYCAVLLTQPQRRPLGLWECSRR